MNLDIHNEVLMAHDLIRSYIRRTPLEYSPKLSELSGAKVFLKLENWQITGSFKIRGALNKILPLGAVPERKQVVTASTGNHAAAVGHALEKVRLPGIIFLPSNVSKVKMEKLESYKQISLETYGEDSVDTEIKAKEYAIENDCIYVSPYNDIDVVTGQGTIGLELYEQMENIDSVLVPVGGGGLISGIAGYLKNVDPNIEIVGCQPENSAVMYESVQEGRIMDLPSLPTISDGTAGGVEEESITYDFCKNLVEKWILVTENEILESLKLMMNHHNMIVEGSAALALAALMKEKERYSQKSVVLIICGGKFSIELVRKLVCE